MGGGDGGGSVGRLNGRTSLGFVYIAQDVQLALYHPPGNVADRR